MALVAGELSGIPWSITAHRFDIVENNLLNVKAKKARFVRAINERGARELTDRISSEAAQPFVLHMGIVLPPPIERSSASRREHFRIVTPANLLEVKGHAYLLEAVRLLRDRQVPVSLDLAGAGPLRRELERRTEELGLQEQVSFLGAVPHQKLLAQLNDGVWDMLVLPSVVTVSGEKEGIPVAVIEAMGCRVTVVSTTTGGIPELFEGISDPPLVPPEDPEALADTIERQIQDPELRQRLVEEGRRRVEESFAIERVVGELILRFTECASSGAQRLEKP
jgi:glycosyltransferase involved in cell wall biosynthesis